MGDAARSGAILGTSFLAGPCGEPPLRDNGGWERYFETVLVFDGLGPRRLRSLPVCMSESGFRALESALGVDVRKLPEWPNVPFLLVDENDVALPVRADWFEPAEVGEVMLLPQTWRLDDAGRVRERALGEPIRVRPGQTELSALAESVGKEGEKLRRFIVLAKGRAPTGIFPLFNTVGNYGGKAHVLVELAPVSEELWAQMVRVILEEIAKDEWLIGPPRTLPDAVRRSAVLSSAWLESRLKKRTDTTRVRRWYTRFPLWDRFDEGLSVKVRISPKGREAVREFLQSGE